MGSPAYSKERYHWYKAHGICVNCGQTWAEPGRVMCAECARKNAASQRKHDPDGTRHAAYMDALRTSRRAAGLCFECGKPLDGPHTLCSRCLAQHREYAKMYRIRQRIRREAEHGQG